MAENNNSASASVGVSWLGLLGVVFVILKLNPGGYVDTAVQSWSWWVVLLPFYLGFLILLAIAIIALVAYLVAKQVDRVQAAKRRKEFNIRHNR
jgi:heme A synthase